MSKKTNIGLIALAASSFISGVGLGLLLAPQSGKKNRQWIRKNAAEMALWLEEKGRDSLKQGERQIGDFRSRIEKGYRDTIPDLYDATEHIDLDGSRLVDE